MANFNEVNLIGNLTCDPELTFLPNTKRAVCNFGLAINRKWKAESGEERQEVCYVDLVCYGKLAETFHKYTSKGDPVFINGRLYYNSWTAKDGSRRSKLSVVVESFQFLKQKGSDNADRP